MSLCAGVCGLLTRSSNPLPRFAPSKSGLHAAPNLKPTRLYAAVLTRLTRQRGIKRRKRTNMQGALLSNSNVRFNNPGGQPMPAFMNAYAKNMVGLDINALRQQAQEKQAAIKRNMEQAQTRTGKLTLNSNEDGFNDALMYNVWKYQMNTTQPPTSTGADDMYWVSFDASSEGEERVIRPLTGVGLVNLIHQVYVLSRTVVGLEQSCDPKGVMRDAQKAKTEAEAAAKSGKAASQQATQAASEAAGAAAMQAAAAVKGHATSVTAAAEKAAQEAEAASERAKLAAAAAAAAATLEAATAVSEGAKAALDAADKAAKESEVASKRAIASAESSEVTPLMTEIRGLRGARKELDAELKRLRTTEERLAKLEAHCCIQACSIM